ncbi:MAG: hypothetical protein DSM106950_02550 [Stigonema ocellatum SAG 48.90 = DSM 106950]|nr:hypothetical protein [Stigonema ocellatum SAG 48.90 = DSM 106950]
MEMTTKKLLKRDTRGGRRENAGRKSNWKNKDTITIRVPRAIVFQVIDLAHRIDSGETIELDTESRAAQNEIITQSNQNDQELKPDSVTKSILFSHTNCDYTSLKMNTSQIHYTPF